MAYMTIKPTDTLFFRGGKPFNMGDETWSESSYLPHPSVIWGAMFSVLYTEKKITIKQKEGRPIVEESERQKLKIKNIYLYNEKQTTVLLPAPLDIFVDKDDKKYISNYKDINFISNYPLKIINDIETDKEVKPLENHFIEINSLYQHYLRRNSQNLILYRFEDVFSEDYKVGIKLNKQTKTAEKSYLYRTDLTRFQQDWSFLVEYECAIAFEPNGMLKLGGDVKTASYRVVDEPTALQNANRYKTQILDELESKKYFRLLFKTPAYFKDGWHPEREGLMCANVGKHLSIGGFDMQTNKPKPMKRYIPAGSVYVFENKGDRSFVSEDEESYKGFGCFEILSV